MLKPAQKRRSPIQHGAWLALFALVIQLALPLVHFCGLDSGHRPHSTEQEVTATATVLPPGQTALQEANALPPGSDHDHATCPVCRSLQRLGAGELPTVQVWAGQWLTVTRLTPFQSVSFSGEPEWNTSSPRGPPRNS